jgi:hypothetical protein
MNRSILLLCLFVVACDTTSETKLPKNEPLSQAPIAEVAHSEVVGTHGGITLRSKGSAAALWKDGDSISAGTVVETDQHTRARLTYEKSVVVVSHATTLTFDGKDEMTLGKGRVVIEAGETPLRVNTPAGTFALHQAKASLVVNGTTVTSTVSQGYVEAQGKNENVLAHPGMEVVWHKGTQPTTRWSNALGSELGWSADVSEKPSGTARPSSGLGKLVGKQPNGERERPLELVSHAVNVRVQGNVAFTEIHEAFKNPTGETLEGMYRFPLPADAQIASLSLKVGNRWMDGEFMETARAERIFRDVVDQWLDPALLKWKQGNQFELRIFPILPSQVREVKIGYIQTLARDNDGYRFTYPMPVDVGAQIPAGKFSINATVFGVDAASPVSAEGYDATIVRGATEADVSVARVSYEAADFVAAGDFTVRFARPKDTGVNVYAFDETIRKGEPSYAAVTVRPDLGATAEVESRDFVLVADTSYSRQGATHSLQAELVGRLIAEMDPQDRVTAIACSATCRPLGAAEFSGASIDRAREAAEGLSGTKPAGTFNAVEALRVAERMFNSRDSASAKRAANVIFISDGVSSAGAANPDTLRKAVNNLFGAKNIRMTLVDLGGDTDMVNLDAMATGAGGMVVGLDPSATPSANALEVLRHHYGALLTDVRVEWPEGVSEPTLPSATTLAPGDELVMAARFTGPVSGTLVIHGVRSGEAFTQEVPLNLMPSTSKASAFVPRQWAAMRIADLDLEGDSRRTDIIGLSVRYGVLSRHTALLALEDEQMMDDYGVRKQKRAEMDSAVVEAEPAADEDNGALADGMASGAGREPKAKKPSRVMNRPMAKEGDAPTIDIFHDGSTGRKAGPSKSDPADSKEASRPLGQAMAEKKAARADLGDVDESMKVLGWGGSVTKGEAGLAKRSSSRGRRAPKMVRTANISAPQRPTASEDRSAANKRSAWENEPENRTKRMQYIRSLIAANQFSGAKLEVEKWLTLNAMDAEAAVQMAQVESMDGRFDEALTWLESGADAQPRGVWVHQRLADAYAASGRDALACAQTSLLGDIGIQTRTQRKTDILECPMTSDLSLFGLARDRLTGGEVPTNKTGSGDVHVTWTGDPDAHIEVIEPDGRVLSWLSQRRNLKVSGVGTQKSELLLPRVRSRQVYGIWMVSDKVGGAGTLTVKSGATTRVFQVQMRSNRTEVAEVSVSESWRY